MISYDEFEDIVVDILKRDISSNKNQQKAILTESDKSLFIVAGPGSGKTTVMVLKILKYIFVDDINPNEILATTFTRKAAEELYSRILGWGDEIKNYLLDNIDDENFDNLLKIDRIDFNQIKIGTTDSVAEELLRDNKKLCSKNISGSISTRLKYSSWAKKNRYTPIPPVLGSGGNL